MAAAAVARRRLAWLALDSAIAATLALPVPWSSGLSVLVALIALARMHWSANQTDDSAPRGIPASAIAVAAFFALVALPRPAIPLIDGDVYWHIRAGEAVLDTGSVPKTDTWSMVGEGMRWISQDWGSNVLFALGWRTGELGPSILSIGWALLVVAALAILWLASSAAIPMPAGWDGSCGWLPG